MDGAKLTDATIATQYGADRMNEKAPFCSLGHRDTAPQSRGVIYLVRASEWHLLFNQTEDKMVQCAIEGCSSRSDTQPAGFIESAIHFHRIPKDTLIRQKWMKAINKREVKSSSRVCSLHFKKERYYLTKQGFHKLIGCSVPEIKLPYVEEVKEDSSSDEEMTNVLPPKPNISYRSQSQQSSTKEITSEIGTTVNVLGATNLEHVEDVKDDTTDSSSDEEMSNDQPIKHGEEVNGDTTDSSEDEKMSNRQPHQENINLPNQCQQNNSKEMSTDNDKGSSTMKPGVQKHKVKTLLERILLKEVRRLQEMGKKRMEAIQCLLEQNRCLLERNSFLEKTLNDV